MKTLRDLREDRGLAQYEVAELARTTQGYVCRLETGRQYPGAVIIKRLSEAYGVSRVEIVRAAKATLSDTEANEAAAAAAAENAAPGEDVA